MGKLGIICKNCNHFTSTLLGIRGKCLGFDNELSVIDSDNRLDDLFVSVPENGHCPRWIKRSAIATSRSIF